MVLVPLTNKVDSIILSVLILLTAIVPLFLDGKEAYNIFPQLLVRVCFVAAYYIFVRYETRYAQKVLEGIENDKKIRYMSITDRLTGLFNRHAFYDYMQKVNTQEDVKKLGFLILDIDFFKFYNDYYTHFEGDYVLKMVGDLLEEISSYHGLYAFRFGGEEFVILYPNGMKDDLLYLGEEIHSAIWNMNYQRQDITTYDRITVTIGLATSGNTEKESKELLTAADKQLYLGKNNGRNCIVFNDVKYVIDPKMLGVEEDAAGRYVRERIGENGKAEKLRPEKANKISVGEDFRKVALVVDDLAMNREILADLLDDSYEIMNACDGLEAVEMMEKYANRIAVVLLDIVMPNLDGMGVMKIMNEKGWIHNIPVLIISAESNAVIERECLEYGASDFIHKPFSEMLVKARIQNTIERYAYRNQLEQRINDQMAQLKQQNAQLQKTVGNE